MSMQCFSQATGHSSMCSEKLLLETEYSARVSQKGQLNDRCEALSKTSTTFEISTSLTRMFRLRRLSYSTKLNGRGLGDRPPPLCSVNEDRRTSTCQSRSS